MVSNPFGALLPQWGQLVENVLSMWDNQLRVTPIGLRGHLVTGAGDVRVRYLASRATQYVQVHVQHDGVGGGGATYSAGTYVSSTRVDCRENRQQDATVTRNGTDRYYLYLVPVRLETDGTYTLMNGVDGADQMSFVELGA